jgi:hemerythrin superfamily protein
MDAITLLKNDHKTVEKLFKEFEKTKASAPKTRRRLVDKMIQELSIHTAIEEQVFYPAVREDVPDTDDTVLEGLEEHHIVKWTLAELKEMDPGHERFEPKVTVLMESVRHHVKEEEKVMFPKVRKAFSSSELDDMGARLVAAKRTAPRRPHPRSPDTPPGNFVATAVTAPLDAAAKLNTAAARRVRDIVS